jgi:GntR family transcriptional repressor for pyruvate dehydrogenase complex
MTKSDRGLEHLQKLDIRKPAELVLEKIRGLIVSGVLKPGDHLPSERALAEKLAVGRGHVREALKKLELYGIVRTIPNTGTIVASLGVKALEGLISNLISLDDQDFKSLIETRSLLEVQSARLAASRATERDLAAIAEAHREFREHVEAGERALEEDHVFHLRIAHATHNNVLASLISLLTPDIIAMNRNFVEPEVSGLSVTPAEHERIWTAIRKRDESGASRAMAEHMEHSRRRRLGAINTRGDPGN